MFVIGKDMDVGKLAEAARMVQVRLSQPGRRKSSGKAVPQVTGGGKAARRADICRAVGVDRETVVGRFHVVGHALTGRCMGVQIKYRDELQGVLGRYFLMDDGRAEIWISGNMDAMGQLKTFCHECGHALGIDLWNDERETTADAFASGWLDVYCDGCRNFGDYLNRLETFPG